MFSVIFSSYGKTFDLVFCTIMFCVSAVINTVMSISDGLDPDYFLRKMEITQSKVERMDGKLLFPAEVIIFFCKSYDLSIFLICSLTWHLNI